MVFVTLSHGCNSQRLSDAQETQETQVASEKNLPRVTVRVADYEEIQADIFDHLLAVVPEFGLRIFQRKKRFQFIFMESGMIYAEGRI